VTAVDPLAEASIPVPVTFVSPSAELGGAEEYLLALLGHLGNAWVDGIVLLAEGPARGRFEALEQGVETIATSARLGVVPSSRSLRRTLRRLDPRVVHANGVKAALVAVMAVRGLDIPVVWVKHDFSWDGPLARWIGRRCRMVVGVSRAVTETFDGHAVDVRVVLNGLPTYEVDRRAARATLLAASGLEEDARVILQVGRLETGKGQLELVEQVPRLLRTHPDARIALVGPPSRFEPGYQAVVEARVRELGVEDAVRLLGHRADAIELMAGADVVAVPTFPYTRPGTGEGFGLVAAEAMAVGTPVVAYAHGGLPEVIGDCGLLVPPRDGDALRHAIARLLGDAALWDDLARRGRERAGTFELAAVAEAMRQLYREAAGLPVDPAVLAAA
jgi:glycosyltransferase involved in cell wall biosynthesis